MLGPYHRLSVSPETLKIGPIYVTDLPYTGDGGDGDDLVTVDNNSPRCKAARTTVAYRRGQNHDNGDIQICC